MFPYDFKNSNGETYTRIMYVPTTFLHNLPEENKEAILKDLDESGIKVVVRD